MTERQHKSVWMYLYDLAFKQAYANLGGIRTRFVEAGEDGRPIVVMLHGLGGSWENCFANIGAHAEHFKVYALDMLGHGLSDKPDRPLETADYAKHLGDFMDHLKIAKASLVGLSLGSWVSTRFATLSPERVQSVTMISAWGRPVAENESADVKDSREMLAKSREQRLQSVMNPTWQAMEKIFEGLIASPEDRIPDLLAIRQAFYQKPEMKKGMANIFAGIDPEPWSRNAMTDEQLSKIRIPFLVVSSPDYKDVFLQSSHDYARLIPDAKLVEFSGASHWPQWERVEDFNRVNIEFLKSVHKLS